MWSPAPWVTLYQFPFAVPASPHVQGPHMPVCGTTGDDPHTLQDDFQLGSEHFLHTTSQTVAIGISTGALHSEQRTHFLSDFGS